MKNILITGSNGYLGSKFISSYSNVFKFETFSLLTQQFEDIEFEGIDTVLHCAALVHQKKKKSFDVYNQVNTKYPSKLAALAKQSGVKQFVFISTIAVHDDKEDYITENTICKPSTPYGKSKYDAENLLLSMNEGDFKVSIIRVPMIYGKNAPGNIASLLKLITLCPILPLGNINNKRTFISIQNICYALSEVIKQSQDGIFLFGDNDSISTTKLVELISESVGRRVYLIEALFLRNILKKIRPNIYDKLFGNLVVDSSSSQKKLKLKNPYKTNNALKLVGKTKY
ncbi:NAD-dependent epimerase/dehydratase family protein [Gammaproteobacteria bacterium]|nr:NAD-dependent epimerase/dehydratase family protein [Gammaproteobacteria bacterium]MDA9101851.1 NAD-dependent epimerase/dehydratase family protein [Gammaproteobacteria bacterium]